MNAIPLRLAAVLGAAAMLLASVGCTPDLVQDETEVVVKIDGGAYPIAPPRGSYHIVESGDTLSSVARRCGVTVPDLVAVNRITHPDQLTIGDLLRVPRGALVPAVAATPAPRPGTRHTGPIRTESTFKRPLQGSVVRAFGAWTPAGSNYGIDIAAKPGASVKAAKTGVAQYVSDSFPGFGKVVLLDHGNDEFTFYAHNSAILVADGELVKQGETIARAGSTGRATTPQLHFRIYRGGRPRDPAPLLN